MDFESQGAPRNEVGIEVTKGGYLRAIYARLGISKRSQLIALLR
jgi:hypothetical protein